MFSNPEAFNEDNVVATESALGALGKVIYFQRDNNLINDQVVEYFLSKLPLFNEEEEAQKTHGLFVEQCLKANTNIINERNQSLVKETLTRIRNRAADASNDVEVISEEDLQNLNKLLQ